MPDLIPRTLRALMPSRRRQGPSRVEAKQAVMAAYYEALHAAGLPNGRAGRWSLERAVAEGYERSLWGFRCIDTISNHAASVPFQVLDGEKPVKDHPLVRLLNGRANPLETGQQLRERLSAQVLLSPRGAFVEVTFSRGGDPVRLDLLPPGRTRPVPGEGDVLLEHFEVLHLDGTRREVEPEYVRWFRKPHPTNPFRGITPLEAAGFSIELDFFARLYNLQFLRNDGRPAGVIAVDGEMDPKEMDRIEERFSSGPLHAGELAVINGQLSYVDLAKTPRDAAYQVTAKTAKEEILAAFGVGESVLGNASGRTFSNAEEEMTGFWLQVMKPHFSLLSTGWDDDAGDDLTPGWDLSQIEALQRAKDKKVEQARLDFAAGLITLDEYREIAGLEPVGIPETRCLYLPSGKTRVATSEADRKTLQERDQPPAPPQPPEPPELPEGRRPLALPPGKPPVPGEEDEEREEARKVEGKSVRPVLKVVRVKQPAMPAAPDPATSARESAPNEDAFLRLEQSVEAALQALVVRWVERTVARMRSPKRRMGTRHWEASGPRDGRAGDGLLDHEGVVDAAAWSGEAAAALEPILAAAAHQAALDLVADLTGGAPADVEEKAPRRRTWRMVVDRQVREVADAAAAHAAALAGVIREYDEAGRPLERIVEEVRARGFALSGWAQRVAIQTSTGTINGARDAAASQLDGATITRMWLSRRDHKVRPTHKAADGQVRELDVKFKVGGVLLDFPGDPDGPAGEIKNCRCRLLHRNTETGRFVKPPLQVKLSQNGRHVPGTPYEWRHGWIPLTPQVAARWKKPWPPDGLAPADAPGRSGAPDKPRGGDGKPDAPDVPERAPGPLDGIDLPDLDDNEIADLFVKHGDDPDTADALMNEMQRRDDDERDAARRGGYDPDAGDTEDDRKIAVLVGRGWDFKDAYAEVFDLDPAELDREERRAGAEAMRLPGETIDDTVRRMYDEWVHLQWLEAENATNGYLTRRGSNVDPVSLFSGPAHVARAHASEELMRWWEDNPRQTYQQFKAEILARAGDVAGAQATRERRGGREFGV